MHGTDTLALVGASGKSGDQQPFVALSADGRRWKRVQTDVDAIAEAHVLLVEFERLWRGRLDRLGDVLAEPVGEDKS